MHVALRKLVWLVLVCWGIGAAAADLIVYDDAARNGFDAGYSFGGGTNLTNTSPVHSGTYSIAFTGDAYASNGLSFAHPGSTFAPGTFSALRLFIHGGATGGQRLALMLAVDSGTPVLGDAYLLPPAPANGWMQVDLPLSALDFTNDGSFDRIDFLPSTNAQPTLYIDDITLIGASAAAATNYIFGDGFEPEYMFVPQYGSHAIKVYQRTPNSSTFTLKRTATLANGIAPNAVTFAPDGALWVVDDDNALLRRYTLQSILSAAAPAPTVSVGPVGNGSNIFDLAFFGAHGYVSQSDFGGNDRVLKFSIANLNAGVNTSTVLADGAHPLSVPAALAFDAQGRLWISNYDGGANPTIMRMNTATGLVDRVGKSVAVGGRASLSNPEGIRFDEYGNLWVGNNGEPTLSMYTAAQINSGSFGATTPTLLLDIGALPGDGFVGGIAFDRRGDLRVNFEYDLSVRGYSIRATPVGGGYGNYGYTPLAPLNNATSNPGRGGIAIWPVPRSMHMR